MRYGNLVLIQKRIQKTAYCQEYFQMQPLASWEDHIALWDGSCRRSTFCSNREQIQPAVSNLACQSCRWYPTNPSEFPSPTIYDLGHISIWTSQCYPWYINSQGSLFLDSTSRPFSSVQPMLSFRQLNNRFCVDPHICKCYITSVIKCPKVPSVAPKTDIMTMHALIKHFHTTYGLDIMRNNQVGRNWISPTCLGVMVKCLGTSRRTHFPIINKTYLLTFHPCSVLNDVKKATSSHGYRLVFWNASFKQPEAAD